MDREFVRIRPPLCSTPVEALISNLETEWLSVAVGANILPMTRNDGVRPTNYMCCPSTAYLDYAGDELRHVPVALATALRWLIGLARPLMRASGLDRQVQPNNGLVATNLLPALTKSDIEAVTRDLVGRFPDHAIVWRSINDVSPKGLKGHFEEAGYTAFVSRQVYLFDVRDTAPPVHRDEARDMRLLARPDYHIVSGPWSSDDFTRMAGLYQKLYLEKYTWLNPAYTAAFLELSFNSGFLEFIGLRRDDGRLDGVIGCLDADDAMAAPIVGYDTDLPLELGLYRRLMAIALTRARARKVFYNMSAGAAAFKRNRGGMPALEYMMVYNRHLSYKRQAAGWLVNGLLRSLGVPLLKRFEL